MNKDLLIKAIDQFGKINITVIGDLMLDKFIFGDVDRISPEAPVQVVLISKELSTPGGSGNVSANITALGGKSIVVGIVGQDDEGDDLLKELEEEGIDTVGVLRDKDILTCQKTRVIARGQHIIRIDKEVNEPISKEVEKKVIKFIENNIKDWDAVIVSDYAKGFVTERIVKTIIRLSKQYKKIVIGDMKPKNAKYFKGVFLLAPNGKEAREISGVEDIDRAGEKIKKLLNCNVLITQGPGGMTLFEDDKKYHFPAKAREVFDVSGAGDTVMATLALCLAAGLNLEESVFAANQAAGIVVGKIGTATISADELREDLLADGVS